MNPVHNNDLDMTRAGLEPATYGLKAGRRVDDLQALSARSLSDATGSVGSDPSIPERSATNPVTSRRDLIKILARSQVGNCGKCGEEIYWSIESFGGRWVAVSIVGHDTHPPTWREAGAGVLHICPPSIERTAAVQREMSPP